MKTTQTSGFTMIELIAVLLVIGVMSALAVGFFSSTDYATEASEAEQLRMDLRYAQQRAMGSLDDIRVRLNKNQDAYWFDDSEIVFANGARKIWLTSNLKTSPNVIFKAQTGLPNANRTYQLGESSVVKVYKLTGLIQ